MGWTFYKIYVLKLYFIAYTHLLKNSDRENSNQNGHNRSGND